MDIGKDTREMDDRTRWQHVVPLPAAFANIDGADTQTLKSGVGILSGIVFNEIVGLGTVTIYDNSVASGAIIAAISFPVSLAQNVANLVYNVAFSNGLTIVTTGAINITVGYR